MIFKIIFFKINLSSRNCYRVESDTLRNLTKNHPREVPTEFINKFTLFFEILILFHKTLRNWVKNALG